VRARVCFGVCVRVCVCVCVCVCAALLPVQHKHAWQQRCGPERKRGCLAAAG